MVWSKLPWRGKAVATAAVVLNVARSTHVSHGSSRKTHHLTPDLLLVQSVKWCERTGLSKRDTRRHPLATTLSHWAEPPTKPGHRNKSSRGARFTLVCGCLALPQKTKRQNQQLAQKYQVRGYPTVIFARADGKPIAQYGYDKGGPEAWTKKASDMLK